MATGTKVGQLELDLLLNSESFKTQLQTAVNSAITQSSNKMGSKVSSTFSKLGKMAVAAFSVRAVAGFVKEATDLGSDLAEVQNVVDSTFTTMNNSVNAFASTAMKQFGLSETVAKRYTGTMGAMAKSFGFTEQEAFNMSTTLTGLVGDVASFYNLSSDVAYTKLKAVFTGETEALKELGVVMTQTALDEFALAKGYGKTTKAMNEQEKVALRFAFVQDRLSTATGDFVRTQDGWANQMRVLSLQWQQFKANIGQGFIAALTPLVKSLNQVMERLVYFSKVFKAMMEQIYGKQPESAGSGVAAIAGEMAQLENNTNGVGTAAQKTAKKLKSLMGFDNLNVLADNSDLSSGGGLGSSFNIPTTEWDTSNNMFEDALDIPQEHIDKLKTILKIVGLIGTAIAGWKIGKGVGDILKLIPQLKDLKSGLVGVGGALALTGGVLEGFSLADAWKEGFDIENFLGTLGGGGGLIAGAAIIGKAFGSTLLGGGIGAIIAGIPMAIVGVKDAWEKGLNWLNGVLIPAGTTLAGAGVGAIIGSLGGPIGTGIGALIGLIVGALTDLIIWIVQNYTEISKFFEKILIAAWEWVSETYTKISKFFEGILIAAWEWIADVWSKIAGFFTAFGEKIKNTWESVCQFFSSFGERIKNTWNGITTWFGEKLEAFKQKFSDIFTNIKEKVVGVFNSIKTAIKTPINAVIKMLNKMIDGINNLNFTMPEWVPIVGGKSLGFTIPEIPLLAEGGYVKPDAPQLAVIGDNRHNGEIVAPENKLHEAVAANVKPVLAAIQQLMSVLVAQGQNGGGDITIPIYLDGSLLEDFVVTAQDRKALRSGGLA